MPVNEEKFYFLNWELLPSADDLLDATQGNELIEIYIQDIDRCGSPVCYTLPIVQVGQSFTLLRANLLYPKDMCSVPLRNLFVSIRIVRGVDRQIIYTNDCYLSAPFYANQSVYRIPIYRVWYWDDYIRFIMSKLFF